MAPVVVEALQQEAQLQLEDGWKIIWWQYNEEKYDFSGQQCWYDYDLLTQQQIEEAFLKHEKGSGKVVGVVIGAVNIGVVFGFGNMRRVTYPNPETGKRMVRKIRRSAILAM